MEENKTKQKNSSIVETKTPEFQNNVTIDWKFRKSSISTFFLNCFTYLLTYKFLIKYNSSFLNTETVDKIEGRWKMKTNEYFTFLIKKKLHSVNGTVD